MRMDRRTYGPYVRLVRTGLGMIGMLAECSSLPCGELFSATTDIAHGNALVTILHFEIAKKKLFTAGSAEQLNSPLMLWLI